MFTISLIFVNIWNTKDHLDRRRGILQIVSTRSVIGSCVVTKTFFHCKQKSNYRLKQECIQKDKGTLERPNPIWCDFWRPQRVSNTMEFMENRRIGWVSKMLQSVWPRTKLSSQIEKHKIYIQNERNSQNRNI